MDLKGWVDIDEYGIDVRIGDQRLIHTEAGYTHVAIYGGEGIWQVGNKYYVENEVRFYRDLPELPVE